MNGKPLENHLEFTLISFFQVVNPCLESFWVPGGEASRRQARDEDAAPSVAEPQRSREAVQVEAKPSE